MITASKRFEKWKRLASPQTQYLAEEMASRVVPIFISKKFEWRGDYAAGDTTQVGANEIPLQKRGGELWDTVQIVFDRKGRPFFQAYFSSMPKMCHRNASGGHVEIPREEATAIEAPAYFSLRRGVWSDYRDAIFGFNWLTILSLTGLFRLVWFKVNPKSFLNSEIEAFIKLLPQLFETLDRGIPAEWIDHDFGKVAKHVTLLDSWKIRAERGRRSAAGL